MAHDGIVVYVLFGSADTAGHESGLAQISSDSQ